MAETFAAVQPLLDEYADIESQLADPAVHADGGRARTLGRRFAELGRVVAAHAAWKAKAQMTVDNAHMRYFIVHMHRLLDPDEARRADAR